MAEILPALAGKVADKKDNLSAIDSGTHITQDDLMAKPSPVANFAAQLQPSGQAAAMGQAGNTPLSSPGGVSGIASPFQFAGGTNAAQGGRSAIDSLLAGLDSDVQGFSGGVK